MEKDLELQYLSKEKFELGITIRMTKSQNEKIKAICARYKVKSSDLFRYMIEEFLKKYKLPEDGKAN